MYKFPDFLCVGFQKCGTTWLNQNLKIHPNIWVPPIKETFYFNERYTGNRLGEIKNHISYLYNLTKSQRFSRQFNKIIKLNLKSFSLPSLLWAIKYFLFPRNDRWYASLFKLGGSKVLGEIAPTYANLDPKCIAHIHHLMPDVKLIFILRNPIDRAWSQAQMYINNHLKKIINSLSEQDLIEAINKSALNDNEYNYLQAIKNWRNYYPEEQFLIAFFEEIMESPELLLSRICDFLEVETPNVYIDSITKEKVNPSLYKVGIPDNIAIYLAQNYFQEVQELSHCFGSYANDWLLYCNNLLQEL